MPLSTARLLLIRALLRVKMPASVAMSEAAMREDTRARRRACFDAFFAASAAMMHVFRFVLCFDDLFHAAFHAL